MDAIVRGAAGITANYRSRSGLLEFFSRYGYTDGGAPGKSGINERKLDQYQGLYVGKSWRRLRVRAW